MLLATRFHQGSQRCGAVLFEVVLALVLFAGAAAIISGGLKASLDGAERLRLNTHAANLAVTVLSELQAGIRSISEAGPEEFEPPFEAWTWELQTLAGDFSSEPDSAVQRIEIVIRHADPVYVYRLAQSIRLDDLKSEPESEISVSF